MRLLIRLHFNNWEACKEPNSAGNWCRACLASAIELFSLIIQAEAFCYA